MFVSSQETLSKLLEGLSSNELLKVLEVIGMLSKSGKLSRRYVRKLIQLLKELQQQDPEYIKKFMLELPQENKTDLEQFVHNNFGNAQIEVKNDDFAVRIGGEGFHYRRSLDSDLQKLLD